MSGVSTEFPNRLEKKNPGPLCGLKVLAVEDHDDARKLVGMILRQAGADVEVASSFSEAIRVFHERQPDIVVSDIGMPGQTGYDLIRQIRAMPTDQGGDVPAIALTAWTRSEERTAALRAGFQMHLPKPLDAGTLVRSVAELAGRTPSG